MVWFPAKRKLRKRDALVPLFVGLGVGLIVLSSFAAPLRGLTIDILTALGPRFGTPASHVSVVALDEETYRTEPFEGTPYVTWTPEVARVLSAVVAGGAKVVGFDIVFPTSIEQSRMPLGETTLGDRTRGFDKDFLRALADIARENRIVLGQFVDPQNPILPAPGQRAAVDHQRNIRPLDTNMDADGVIRSVPLRFTVDGVAMPGMAAELATRAGTKLPFHNNALTLNFAATAPAIPTYSLADLRACAAKGDRAFFARNFGGRVVLVGGVLGVEDRKLTSRRFLGAPMAAPGERCQIAPAAEADAEANQTIPGVFVHAVAIDNLIDGKGLREIGALPRAVMTVVAGIITGAAAIVLGPLGGGVVSLLAAAALIAAAFATFTQASVLPMVETLFAAAASFGMCGGYRFAVSYRETRLLRHSFSLYLAPAVIDSLVRANRLPELGGETRTVTVLFFDLERFSELAETSSPVEVVKLINSYFSAMADTIESLSGFVDQYLGDGIKAVFGAPLDDPHHAVRAVHAALRCQDALDHLNQGGAGTGPRLVHRIGINSGPSLVGNIGSRRRFNYAVIGDPVNVASRAEGANKFYGTTALVTEQTVALCGDDFLWRELDAVRFKGRAEVVKIYQPLGEAQAVSAELRSVASAYARGLAAWRGRDFAGAVEAFGTIAEQDRPAALFMERARRLLYSPLAPDWEPVTKLET